MVSTLSRLIVCSFALATLASAAWANKPEQLDPNSLRFTQQTAGGNGRTAKYREAMRGGKWIGPPLQVVRMPDGSLVSLDNTRLAIAQEMGVKNVPALVQNADAPLSNAKKKTFTRLWNALKDRYPDLPEPKTWQDALRLRTLSNDLPVNGTARRPILSGDPPTLTPSDRARQTFEALDTLADSRNGSPRELTPAEVTQQKKAGGAGRIAEELLGQERARGSYTVPRNQWAGPGSGAPQMTPSVPRSSPVPGTIGSERLTRPSGLNSYLERSLSARDLDELYREAIGKRIEPGPVKLNNGQTWFLNRYTGEFRPLGGPGVLQLTGQEVKHLDALRAALRNGASPADALQGLARDMARQGTTLSPEMARALKTLGQTRGFVPEEIAAALESRMPRLEAVKGAPKAVVDDARRIANGRPFKLLKYGGRVLLAVAVAADAYEIYVAEDKARAATKVAGGWAGGLGAGAAAASYASPMLAAGPPGWIGYGVVTVGAGVLGYIIGENVAETVYDSAFAKPDAGDGGGGW